MTKIVQTSAPPTIAEVIDKLVVACMFAYEALEEGGDWIIAKTKIDDALDAVQMRPDLVRRTGKKNDRANI